MDFPDERVAVLESQIAGQLLLLSAVREGVTALDRRLLALDQKLDQRFAWLVGLQTATRLAVVAAMTAMGTR